MLSLGKLNPGRAAYYSEQLPGGADEYYTRGEREHPAIWLGSAAGRLGLGGEVTPEAFRALLDANHPMTGDPLGVPKTTVNRLAGFDLCFSAPKSVSVMWALAPPEIAERVASAHDRAVTQAVGAFETEVVRARRGKRAATLIVTEGVVTAGFAHRSSRAGDPQVHTHVVVPNLTVDPNGRWSALAGDRVYMWAKTIGYLYQAALRAELTETLGVTWGPVHKGSAEIAGVDPALVEGFSKRRAEITAALQRSGGLSRSAAEVATLATRRAKDTTSDLADLRRHWLSEATSLGWEPTRLREFATEPRRVELIDSLLPELLSAQGLTASSSSFDRRDVLQALAAGHQDGLHPATLSTAADRFLEHPDVVDLEATPQARRRYTTTELLGVEADVVEGAVRRRDDNVGVAERDDLERSLEGRPSLSDEQKQMIESLTTSGAGVEVVVGRAGTGKTFALDAARDAWESAGHNVIGAALAARAAAELQAGAGIPSTTLDRLLAELDIPGPLSALPVGSVVVVDEAGMIGTRKLARLLAHAQRADAKVVLVGDHRQLPEIQAGGAFAALAKSVPTTELVDNRRQANVWEREALEQLRGGSVADAYTAYSRQGRITLTSDAPAAREAMVSDWWSAHRAGERAAMYALRRSDVEDLNSRARVRLDKAGALGEQRIDAAGREFAPGDEVICLRNDRRLGVRNGTRSTIESVDPTERTVMLAGGKVLPAAYLDAGHLGHGYATTIHKAQGATVDRAFLLGSEGLYREAGYVGLSRARLATQLYVVAAPQGREAEIDPIVETIRWLNVSKAQHLASEDLEPHRAPGREPESILADPEPWLLDALGPPPVTPDRRDEWARHAERLAAYRDIYQITDTADPLGPFPDDPTQRRAWDLARLALIEHHRSLELEQGLEI